MKPIGHSQRPRDWIPLANFALVERIEPQLVLREHLLPYAGAPKQTQLLWGVHGTTSINAAVFAAAAEATRRRCQSLQVTTWYRVDNFSAVTTPLTRESSRAAGYLHLGRLNAAFREDIRATWLDWLAHEDPAAHQRGADAGLEDLALWHPEIIARMLLQNDALHMVIHPVRADYATPGAPPLWVATVRADPERIMASEVRYVPDVQVL